MEKRDQRAQGCGTGKEGDRGRSLRSWGLRPAGVVRSAEKREGSRRFWRWNQLIDRMAFDTGVERGGGVQEDS